MNTYVKWFTLVWLTAVINGCGGSCDEATKTMTPGKEESGSENVPANHVITDDLQKQSSEETSLQLFTTNKKFTGKVEVKPSLPLPSEFKWYGIEAEEKASVHGNQAMLARDDDLLTAWTCDMNQLSPCVYTLQLEAPAEICAIRLFATFGDKQSNAQTQGFTKMMKVHTDEGVVAISLQRRFNYQHIVFPECMSTSVVSLEAVDFFIPSQSPRMAISEVELLGPKGPKRAPVQLRDNPIVTVTDGSFWVSKTQGCDNCVYQGSAATPAWLEQIDDHGERKRLAQGHSAIITRSGRFVFMKKTLSEYCPGAMAYKSENFTLFDTHSRMMYRIPFTSLTPDTDDWEIFAIYRHAEKDIFAMKLWSTGSSNIDWLVSIDLENNRSRVTQRSLSNFAYEQMDTLLVYMGYEVPTSESTQIDSQIPPQKRERLCLEIPRANGALADESLCENAVKYQHWSQFSLADGKTLIFTSSDLCMTIEDENHAFAAILDTNGTIIHSISTTSYMSIHFYPNDLMIEVDNFTGTAGASTDTDIYIIDDNNHFIKAYPGAAFELPASPGCYCEA